MLIGRYWLAHHQFFSALRSVDRVLIGVNLVYLAFVAFLPFPVTLIGRYEENPTSVLLFALCMSAISGLEVLLFVIAARHNHTRHAVSEAVFRFGVIGASLPVVIFLLSIPIAFVNPSLALLSWLLMIPLSIVLHRRQPEGVDEYLLGSSHHTAHTRHPTDPSGGR